MKSLFFKPRLPDDHRVDELKKLKEALNDRDTESAGRTPVHKKRGKQE